MSETISLAVVVRKAMVDHARREGPRECCGLLVGRARSIDFAVPMANVEPSATRFRIGDVAHIELRRAIRAFHPPIDIVGVYHSHPLGPAAPSATDVAEAMYPEWLYVIVGFSANRPEVRAYRIRDGRVRKVALRIRR